MGKEQAIVKEAQVHAINAARDPSNAQTVSTKYADRDEFLALALVAETWIERPPHDMWSLSQGKGIIAALRGELKPNQDAYYTACISFKDYVEKKKAEPEVRMLTNIMEADLMNKKSELKIFLP